jgi:hypothetical protein
MKALRNRFLGFLLSAIVVLLASQAMAQESSVTEQTESNRGSSALKINGEVGAYGELYNISGQENRRPGSTGRLYLRSTVSAWNSLSIDLNFLLSTENSSARQALNKFGINPRWGWGEAHLGSFSESYSPLTLNGIEIRGGGVRLSGGFMRLALITGLTKREVIGHGGNKSYQRLLSGGFLGFGKQGGTSFELIAITARDRLSDALEIASDSTSIPDSSAIDTLPRSQSVTPQENLVVSALTNISFSKRRVTLKSEISGCAITRDRRAAELESADIPEFAKNIFTPRVSSSADFASMNEINIALTKMNIKAGYNYIGPGYVSLGVASLVADKQELFLGLSYRLKKGTVRFDLSRQNDNLIKQKSFTTDRNRFSWILNMRPISSWGFNWTLTYQTVKNDAADSIRSVNFNNWVLANNHSINFRRSIGVRSILLDYIFQTSKDKNTLRKGSAIDAHTISVRVPYGIKENLDITPQTGINTSRVADGSWKNTLTLSLLTQYLMLQSKLVSSLQISYTKSQKSHSLQNNFRLNYRLDDKSSINTELGINSFRGNGIEKDFDEFTGQITISRQF